MSPPASVQRSPIVTRFPLAAGTPIPRNASTHCTFRRRRSAASALILFASPELTSSGPISFIHTCLALILLCPFRSQSPQLYCWTSTLLSCDAYPTKPMGKPAQDPLAKLSEFLAKPKTPPNPNTHRCYPTAHQTAVAVQQLLLADIQNPKTTPTVRAVLVRAWDILEERKRILRGIPSPGQLRPDLDPVQLARAVKRHRKRQPILELRDAAGPCAVQVLPDDEPAEAQPTQQPAVSPELVTKKSDRQTQKVLDETRENPLTIPLVPSRSQPEDEVADRGVKESLSPEG